ncbi:MAG: hypothetical protein SOV43_09135 [Selenomonadaceae bacterium]|nr:hypothetical protein [Selenomonadaceae bacterium]MDY2686318.1 hypothetical protein [Selenomonadaceae bacterium]
MAKSLLIKDTTREEREEIVRRSLNCASGCENCSGCALGVGDPYDAFQPYIDGKMEIEEINRRFRASYGIH